MLPHPLTYFEIQKYYQNKPRFNGVYSRDHLQKIKDGKYIINLDEYSDIGTHWIDLFVLNTNVTYFHSFGVDHTPKKIKNFIGGKKIKTNIFIIQAYDLIICGSLCIGFINFILEGKSLTNITNLFSPKDLKKMIALF